MVILGYRDILTPKQWSKGVQWGTSISESEKAMPLSFSANQLRKCHADPSFSVKHNSIVVI